MKNPYWKKKDGKFLLESEAFALASVYYKAFNTFNKKHIRISQVKKSKHWNAFLKTIEIRGSNEEWDRNLFIKILFDVYGMFYPFKLYSQDAWDVYLEYYKRGFKNKDKTVALSLLSAYKEIQTWSRKKKIEGVSVKAYFKNPLNIALLENKKPSPYFLSICKTFKDYYRELFIANQIAIIKPSELESARRAVYSNKKILKKMKDLLGEEFDGGVI